MTFTVGPLNATSVATETFTSTAPVPVTSGGTGVTTSTGTGAVVLNTSPVLVTPTLGNATATSIATQTLTSATPIPISSGGTGSSTATGTGIPVLNNSPTLTGAVLTAEIINSGSIFSDGGYFVHQGNSNNQIYYDATKDGPIISGNTGGALGWTGSGGFVPELSWDRGSVYITSTNFYCTPPATFAGISATSLTLTTPLPTSSGGIGQNSTGTNGQVLISNGSGGSTWGSPSTGSVTSVGISVPSFLSVSGSPITSSGTIAITGASTGTGSVVLSAAPTITGTLSTSTIVNSGDIYLKAGDTNTGLCYDTFNDGLHLFGPNGGVLGTTSSGPSGFSPRLQWNGTEVIVTGPLVASLPSTVSTFAGIHANENVVVAGDIYGGSVYVGSTSNVNNGMGFDSITDNGPHIFGASGGALGTTSSGPGGFIPRLVWNGSQVVINGTLIASASNTVAHFAGILADQNVTVTGTSTFNSDVSVTGHFNLNGSELYQTGQWTPTAGQFSATTYSRLSSSEQYFYNDWSKVGNVVTVSLSMVFNSSGGASGQGFCLMGLPFPAKSPVTFLPSSTNNYTGTLNGVLSLGIRPTGANVSLAGGTYHATGLEVIYYSGLGGGSDAVAGTITSGESGLWIEFTATYLTP